MEEARRNLDQLRFTISNLQEDASLKSVIDEYTDLTSKGRILPTALTLYGNANMHLMVCSKKLPRILLCVGSKKRSVLTPK
jgi:hypothetical protein